MRRAVLPALLVVATFGASFAIARWTASDPAAAPPQPEVSAAPQSTSLPIATLGRASGLPRLRPARPTPQVPDGVQRTSPPASPPPSASQEWSASDGSTPAPLPAKPPPPSSDD